MAIFCYSSPLFACELQTEFRKVVDMIENIQQVGNARLWEVTQNNPDESRRIIGVRGHVEAGYKKALFIDNCFEQLENKIAQCMNEQDLGSFKRFAMPIAIKMGHNYPQIRDYYPRCVTALIQKRRKELEKIVF